jgi:hypothetical protein
MKQHLMFSLGGWFVIATAGLGLPGCHTSPVALEQANHTVSLMAELEGQLGEFKRSASAAENARIASLQFQMDRVLASTKSAALDTQASADAGDKTHEPFARKLLGGAEAKGKAEVLSLKQSEDYAARLATLLTPQPNLKPTLAQAQVKAAVLGKDLDPDVRFDELKAFVSDLADNLKANREKIDKAKAAANAADAQAKKAAALAEQSTTTATSDAVKTKTDSEAK